MDSVVFGNVITIVDRYGLQDSEIRGKEFHLHTHKLYQHMFIQGIPGSGKTEFIKNLTRQLIRKNKRVCIVDGAGSPKFAQDICVMAYEEGITQIPVLKYGHYSGESSVFHGFTGDNQAIYNQLVALLALEDTGGEGDHYRALRDHVLMNVCGVNTHLRFPGIAPFEPPRSFHELASRLTPEWWNLVMGRNREAMKVFDSNKAEFPTFLNLIWRRAQPILHLLDPKGFKIGDGPVTMFSINSARGGETARGFIEFLGWAFKDAMGKDAETVWIIDEVGMFGGEIASEFTRIGRQFGLGMVMATQSLASLGDKKFVDEILDTTNIKVIMRNDSADELRRRAGTKIVTDRRKNFDQRGLDRGGSEGRREVDKIRQEDVKTLPTGAMFVCVGGGIVKVQSSLVKLTHSFDESMELKNQAVVSPPPPAHTLKRATGKNPF